MAIAFKFSDGRALPQNVVFSESYALLGFGYHLL
jgi:hypothetical protein